MATPVAREDTLFTRNFLLICLTTLISFIGFYLLIPTLPVYVLQIGGHAADVGLVLGSVTITSVAFRPLIGIQSDRRGRRVILLAGLAGSFIAMALYLFATTIPSMVAVRFLQGIAWAASTTTLTTLIADIAPPARRGEAIGYFGVSSNLAMAVGPALGMAIINSQSFTTLFLVCAVLALIAVITGLAVPETRRARNEPAEVHAKPKTSSFSSEAISPAIVAFLVTISYGSISAFLPLYAKGFGVDNPGLFFTVFAIVLLLSRPLFGRVSDLYGRGAVLVPGIVLMAAGLVVLALSGTLFALVLVGLLFGLGFGASQPALMALAVDRVDGPNRGTAMGYFTAAFDMGVGAGAIVMGLLVQFVGYSNIFLIAAVAAIFGLVALVSKERGRVFGRASRPSSGK
ncbi:MAG: MFS transporter [Chloroflexi bacterium]|nr:MFS transporter [Chloroflexota bacterium]